MSDSIAPHTPSELTSSPAWQALTTHHEQIRNKHLRELFASDPGRGERLCAEAAGWYLDYSKQRITDDTLRLLLKLAQQCGMSERIAAMFRRRSRTPFTLPLTGIQLLVMEL